MARQASPVPQWAVDSLGLIEAAMGKRYLALLSGFYNGQEGAHLVIIREHDNEYFITPIAWMYSADDIEKVEDANGKKLTPSKGKT